MAGRTSRPGRSPRGRTFLSLNQKHLSRFSPATPISPCHSRIANKPQPMTNQNQPARTTDTQRPASPQIKAYPIANNTLNRPSGSFGKIISRRRLALAGFVRQNPARPNLNQTPALATLSLYVSPLRRPASSPSPSGNHHAAGPGLNRFLSQTKGRPPRYRRAFLLPPDPVQATKAAKQK